MGGLLQVLRFFPQISFAADILQNFQNCFGKSSSAFFALAGSRRFWQPVEQFLDKLGRDIVQRIPAGFSQNEVG